MLYSPSDLEAAENGIVTLTMPLSLRLRMRIDRLQTVVDSQRGIILLQSKALKRAKAQLETAESVVRDQAALIEHLTAKREGVIQPT